MSAPSDTRPETERLRRRVAELEHQLAARGERSEAGPGDQDSQPIPRDYFRLLVEHSQDFISMAGLDERLFYINPAGRTLLGIGPQEDINGLTIADVIGEGRLTQLRKLELPAVFERGLWQGEGALRHRKTGESIPVLKQSFLIRDGVSGAPAALATVQRNLADRKQAEEAMGRRIELERLVASISQGFIHCGPEAMSFHIAVTLELLGSFVGADRSHLILVSEDGTHFSIHNEWCFAAVPALRDQIQALRAADYPWGCQRLVDGDVIHVAGLDTLPPEAAAERKLLEASGIRALLLVPLVSESRTIGCIGFNRADSERGWAVADINLLRTVADIIANAMARQHMERELRASQQKFSRIFDASPDVITLATASEGIFVDVNAAFERVTGYGRDEVIGRSSSALHLWEDPHERGQLIERLIRDGSVVDCETRLRRKSGEVFDALVSGFPMRVAERDCIALITRDISERKAMEAALRRSEYVLRAIVENVPDAIWMKDRDGRFIVGNRALARFFGRRKVADIIGRRVDDFLPAVYSEQLTRDDRKVAATRSQLTREERYELRGETRWFETVKAPILDPNGELVGTTGIAHNVTQRKLVEQALRESEARFRQFAEDLPFFIWMATMDRSRVLFVNKSYEHIFGRTVEALKGNPLDWLEAVHPDDRAAIPRLDQSVDQPGPFINEFRIVRPDGGIRWLRNHVVPLKNERGEVYLHAGISEDVTERKAAEEEVHRLNSDLEERVKSRTEALQASLKELESFSYSVSHDLSTPLRGINGFSHLLLQEYADKLDETGTSYLKRICSASERMGLLIDDLLTLAKLSRAELRPVSVDLSQMATDILAEFAFQEPQRQVTTAIAPDLQTHGDPMLLRLLLENLLSNAWKFTSSRSSARIEVGATGEGQVRRYFVRDNGAGFDNAFGDKLFQPFQRLHGVEEFPGSGIGLATVKRIVERHGGEVHAEGAPGLGATFYFTLP